MKKEINTNERELKIISGTINPALSNEISEILGIKLTDITISRFADGEIHIKILESIRGDDVFVIQPTCLKVNEALMELLIIIDALKRASAERITAVIPYYGYARQDRKSTSREPITAKLVANLLEKAGADRVLVLDLHAPQIQGFFDIPVDNLKAFPVMVNYLKEKKLDDIVVVSPDVGGVKRARELARVLNAPLAIIDKRRVAHNEAEVMNIIGDISGKNCVMIDDMIDTAGTITNAAKAISKAGAKDIYACAIHPVLSGPGSERLEKSPLKEVAFTNSIPISKEKMFDKFKVISVAPMVAEAINRIHQHVSVSSLFEETLKK